jgi:hypothetical protein
VRLPDFARIAEMAGRYSMTFQMERMAEIIEKQARSCGRGSKDRPGWQEAPLRSHAKVLASVNKGQGRPWPFTEAVLDARPGPGF